jgi:hypothetical protein
MPELGFKLAQLLPDFLRISSQEEAEEFGERFPDFAPKSWWTTPEWTNPTDFYSRRGVT